MLQYPFVIMYTAKETLCDPNFSIKYLSFTFKTTAANGVCSFGVENVGTYNSTFMQEDIAAQAFTNPAGQYNYSQLLNQAKTQTYVITELFDDYHISPSIFNIFLSNEMIPSTDFLSAVDPSIIITADINPTNTADINPTNVQSSTQSSTKIAITSTTMKMSPTIHAVTPMPSGSGAEVFSYSLIIMLGCSILAMSLRHM